MKKVAGLAFLSGLLLLMIAATTLTMLLVIGNNSIQTQIYASKDKLVCEVDIDCYNDEGTEKVCPKGYHFNDDGDACIKNKQNNDDISTTD